jgi:2-iminobutanoate/2-iminopropanoate deaminase
MEKIYITGADIPAGHYTPGIKSGGMVYISGQLPIDPFTGEICKGDIKAQTQRTLENVRLILDSCGSAVNKVVKVNVFVSDIEMWNEVNGVYKDFFGDHKPARIVVPVNELHYGCLIEIDAVAEA